MKKISPKGTKFQIKCDVRCLETKEKGYRVAKLDCIQLLSLDKQVKLCQSHYAVAARGAVAVCDDTFNWLHLSTVAMCR